MRIHRLALVACSTVMTLALPLTLNAQQHAHGQAPANRPAAIASLLRDLAQVEQKMIALAEAIPEESFGWRPGDGVRSVSEVVMHVAADNYFLPTFAGHPAPAETGIRNGDYPSVQAYEQRQVTKAEAVQAMRDSFAHLRGGMEMADDSFLASQLDVFGSQMTGMDLAVITTTHLHEHLGQLIAYARSNGLVPPWSRS